MRRTSLHSGLHIATALFADGPMVRLSSLGLVSTPKDSDCYLTQHSRLGMNQVPVQEGGFARRAEVLCFLSPHAGPEKPMFRAHLSVVRWIRNRRSTCTTRITYLGSASMTAFPKKSAKIVRSNVRLRLTAREANTTCFHVKHRDRSRAWRARAVHRGAGRDAHVRRAQYANTRSSL